MSDHDTLQQEIAARRAAFAQRLGNNASPFLTVYDDLLKACGNSSAGRICGRFSNYQDAFTHLRWLDSAANSRFEGPDGNNPKVLYEQDIWLLLEDKNLITTQQKDKLLRRAIDEYSHDAAMPDGKYKIELAAMQESAQNATLVDNGLISKRSQYQQNGAYQFKTHVDAFDHAQGLHSEGLRQVGIRQVIAQQEAQEAALEAPHARAREQAASSKQPLSPEAMAAVLATATQLNGGNQKPGLNSSLFKRGLLENSPPEQVRETMLRELQGHVTRAGSSATAPVWAGLLAECKAHTAQDKLCGIFSTTEGFAFVDTMIAVQEAADRGNDGRASFLLNKAWDKVNEAGGFYIESGKPKLEDAIDKAMIAFGTPAGPRIKENPLSLAQLAASERNGSFQPVWDQLATKTTHNALQGVDMLRLERAIETVQSDIGKSCRGSSDPKKVQENIETMERDTARLRHQMDLLEADPRITGQGKEIVTRLASDIDYALEAERKQCGLQPSAAPAQQTSPDQRRR